MQNCPMCGYQNDDTSITCAKCGTDLGYRNQVLFDMITRVYSIDKNVSAIKGWVTFFGVIILIGLVWAVVSSFSVIMSIISIL